MNKQKAELSERSERSEQDSLSSSQSAMKLWTEDAAEGVYKVSKHSEVEVEYRLNCTPGNYSKCKQLIQQLCQSPPKKTVDTILTFVGHVRVHCVSGKVVRIETKQTRLQATLDWGQLKFLVSVAAERPLSPRAPRYKALKAAAERHLKGTRTFTLEASHIEQWNLQPIAVQSGTTVEWLHEHCAKIEWRLASKRERVYVNEPYCDKVGGLFLPFAAVVATCDKMQEHNSDSGPALEAPIMVRHRSREHYEFVDEYGFKFYIDCTSAVEVYAKAKPHLTIEVESAQPRAGPDALWLPDDIVMALQEGCGVDNHNRN